jgi:hypothetical protein
VHSFKYTTAATAAPPNLWCRSIMVSLALGRRATSYHCGSAQHLMLLWCALAAVQVPRWWKLVSRAWTHREATSCARSAARDSIDAREIRTSTEQGISAKESDATARGAKEHLLHRLSLLLLARSAPTSAFSQRRSESGGVRYVLSSLRHKSKSAAHSKLSSLHLLPLLQPRA